MTPTMLSDLVGEIRKAHEAAQVAARDAVAHAIHAGEMLLEAKAALPHGRFAAWLAVNVRFSARTAQGYIQLAKLDDEKRNAVADLSVRSALRRVSRDAIEAKRKAQLTAEPATTAQVPIVSAASIDGRKVSVTQCADPNHWCVRIGPNDTGAKFDPIAWRRAAIDAEEHLPELADLRDALKAAKRDIQKAERALKRARQRETAAYRALEHAAFRHCEMLHGEPQWTQTHYLRVPERTTAVLLELPEDQRHAMAPALLDPTTWPTGWAPMVSGSLYHGDAFSTRETA